MAKLLAVQGNYCVDKAVAATCYSLMDRLDSLANREMWCYGYPKEAQRTYSRSLLPQKLLNVAYRLGASEAQLLPLLEATVMRSAQAGDVAWIWPKCRARTFERLRAKGIRTVMERINTCAGMYDRKVRQAYAHLGWPFPSQRSEASLIDETRSALIADAIFAPNGFVRESLLEIGVPESRIIETSYGWCPRRMAGSMNQATEIRPPRFLFVGSGSVRKGLPHLLDAWHAADVEGELIIAGTLDEDVRSRCGRLLAHPSVRLLGFVDRIADVYRSADVFVFPTHEEGGPQVTFEAAACGLALLVSPMGAAGAFRDGADAVVADPLERDAWIEGLRRYARDTQFLREMQQSATSRSQLYTWEHVAARRLAALEDHFGRFDRAAP